MLMESDRAKASEGLSDLTEKNIEDIKGGQFLQHK